MPAWLISRHSTLAKCWLLHTKRVTLVDPSRLIPYDKSLLAEISTSIQRCHGFPTTYTKLWQSAYAKDVALVSRAETLCQLGLSATTRSTYFHKCMAYIRWGIARGVHKPLSKAVSESDLILYITDRSKKVSLATIEGDLSALRNYHLERNWYFPVFDRQKKWPLLARALEGVRRIQGEKPCDSRKPFTFAMFQQCCKNLQNSTYDNLLLLTVIAVAFFGLLRGGEVTSNDDDRFISLNDVKFFPSWKKTKRVEITIRKSKSSQAAPVKANIGVINSDYCPVNILKQYIRRRLKVQMYGKHIGSQPVFIKANKSHYTLALFRKDLKNTISNIGYDNSCYNTHSLRIGGATMLARCGVADSVIKNHGRWKSNVFTDYIRPNDEELAIISTKIASKSLNDKLVFQTTVKR